MPPDGAIIFGDLIGKLDLPRIECPRVGIIWPAGCEGYGFTRPSGHRVH
jgi:hypothetical protein